MTDANTLKAIQSALIGFETRAEKVSAEKLTETFVDAEPLFALLRSQNHQVMFGRRGTGKTHALRYLAEHVTRNGDIAIYVDLRTVGSNGSIYADASVPLDQRATALLTDVLVAIHDRLLEVANEQKHFINNPVEVTKGFDSLADVIGTVRVVGPVTVETTSETSGAKSTGRRMAVALSATPSVAMEYDHKAERANRSERKETVDGQRAYYVQFGAVQNALNSLLASLGTTKLWLLLDEWSEVPIALQPYLADLIRRTLLPVD